MFEIITSYITYRDVFNKLLDFAVNLTVAFEIKDTLHIV